MDPQFQELAREVADAVEKRLSGGLEERIAIRVEERIKKHIDEFEKRAESSAEDRFKRHIDQFEKRAETRLKMHFENLESHVTLAAEGYDATLKGIERRLTEIKTNVTTKFADHDLVLTDHSKRITKLEERH